MPRHRRRAILSAHEIAQFERDTAAFHTQLNRYFIALKPTHPQYKSLRILHEALLQAVKDVTGHEAYWCRVGPGRMPGPDQVKDG